MKTEITNDLLHANGWQSYCDDELGWFEFDGLELYFYPEDGVWKLTGSKDNMYYWEQLLTVYEKRTGKKFVPKEPVKHTFILLWPDREPRAKPAFKEPPLNPIDREGEAKP